MKRSEMIDNIACILVVNAPYVQAIDIMEIARISKLILEEIEDKGMSPPEHLFTSGERNDHYLQEWESE